MIFRRRARHRSATGLQPQLAAPAARGRRLGQAALFDRLVSRIKEFPGPRHLVDLGCGAGILSLRLAQTCPDLRITGIEASTDLVRVATRTASEAGVSKRLTFARSDLRTLPVPDQSADLVSGAGLLTEAALPETLLAEICRILAPGGTALLVEPASPSDRPEPASPTSRAQSQGERTLTEVQARRLLAICPLRASARVSRPDSDGPVSFLEIELSRPLPEPPRPSHRR